jgi:FSR family fosmidomycin resistance protein-like MFS transporter
MATAELSRPRTAPDRQGLVLLGSGHFVIDMTVGAIPAFIPVFSELFDLSDTEATMILGASVFSSSAVQPAFGWLADRRPSTWFVWGGVLVAAAGLALAGLAGSYWVLIAAVVASGLGVAAFHPEAARVANHLAGDRKATGVAWFSVGGNLGFAVGPLLAALAFPFMSDARATLIYLVPGVAACLVLVAHLDRIRHPVTPPALARQAGARSHRRGVALLVTVVSLRTWTQFGVIAVAPLFLTATRGLDTRETGLVLFGFSMAGALGTLLGALLADRIGGRRMLVVTTPAVTPLLAVFLLTDGAVSLVALMAAGLVLLASFSVTVVMGQEYLPHRLALAAGLLIGFAAIGSGALGLAWIGPLADLTSREAALWSVTALPIVATALSAILPPAPRQPLS